MARAVRAAPRAGNLVAAPWAGDVLSALPAGNVDEVSPTRASELAALGIKVITPDHVQALFDALSVTLPAGPQRVAATPPTQA